MSFLLLAKAIRSRRGLLRVGDMPHAAKIVGSTTSQVKIAQECPKRRFRDDYVDCARACPVHHSASQSGHCFAANIMLSSYPAPQSRRFFAPPGGAIPRGTHFRKNCSSAAWPGIYVKLRASQFDNLTKRGKASGMS